MFYFSRGSRPTEEHLLDPEWGTDIQKPCKCESQEWVGARMEFALNKEAVSFKRREAAPSSTEPLLPLQ